MVVEGSRGDAARDVRVVILARNEAENIGALLGSLLGQDIWRRASPTSTVSVMDNGSSDDTADRAEAAFRTRRDRDARSGNDHPAPGTMRVVHLERPGKSAAWGVARRDVLAHADPDALVVFVDGDVEFTDAGALDALDAALDEPGILVATSWPRFVLPRGRSGRDSLRGRLHGLGSTGEEAGQIWGPLYATRAGTLRRLAMPAGILMDDAYLGAVVATDGLTSPGRADRVRSIPDLCAVVANVGVLDALRSSARVMIGVTINHVVFSWIRGECRGFDESERLAPRHAAEVVDELDAGDPDWLIGVLRDFAADRRFPVDRGYLRRLFTDRSTPAPRRWLHLALKLPFGLAAYVWATWVLKRGSGTGFW